MIGLQDKVAIVTGGGSGIGFATALALQEQGAHVFVGEFDPQAATSAEYERRGIRQIACDVRSEADVQRLVQQTVDHAGGLDILVNNAGVVFVKPITDVTEDEWDKVLDTNLKGVFLLCKHAIPHLRARGGGSIVNVSSNAGLLPRAHDPVYSISKGALNALTRSLALSHSVDRIRVNAVCPGPVRNTRIMDLDLGRADDPEETARERIEASPLARALGRMVDPEEVAQSILYLCSDAAAMVTGTFIAIDGGKSLGVPPPSP